MSLCVIIISFIILQQVFWVHTMHSGDKDNYKYNRHTNDSGQGSGLAANTEHNIRKGGSPKHSPHSSEKTQEQQETVTKKYASQIIDRHTDTIQKQTTVCEPSHHHRGWTHMLVQTKTDEINDKIAIILRKNHQQMHACVIYGASLQACKGLSARCQKQRKEAHMIVKDEEELEQGLALLSKSHKKVLLVSDQVNEQQVQRHPLPALVDLVINYTRPKSAKQYTSRVSRNADRDTAYNGLAITFGSYNKFMYEKQLREVYGITLGKLVLQIGYSGNSILLKSNFNLQKYFTTLPVKKSAFIPVNGQPVSKVQEQANTKGITRLENKQQKQQRQQKTQNLQQKQHHNQRIKGNKDSQIKSQQSQRDETNGKQQQNRHRQTVKIQQKGSNGKQQQEQSSYRQKAQIDKQQEGDNTKRIAARQLQHKRTAVCDKVYGTQTSTSKQGMGMGMGMVQKIVDATTNSMHDTLAAGFTAIQRYNYDGTPQQGKKYKGRPRQQELASAGRSTITQTAKQNNTKQEIIKEVDHPQSQITQSIQQQLDIADTYIENRQTAQQVREIDHKTHNKAQTQKVYPSQKKQKKGDNTHAIDPTHPQHVQQMQVQDKAYNISAQVVHTQSIANIGNIGNIINHKLAEGFSTISKQLHNTNSKEEILDKVGVLQLEMTNALNYQLQAITKLIHQSNPKQEILSKVDALQSSITHALSTQLQQHRQLSAADVKLQNRQAVQQIKDMDNDRVQKQAHITQCVKDIEDQLRNKTKIVSDIAREMDIIQMETQAKQLLNSMQAMLSNKQQDISQYHKIKVTHQKQAQELTKLTQEINTLRKVKDNLERENAKWQQERISFSKNYDLFIAAHKDLQVKYKLLQIQAKNNKEAAESIGHEHALLKQDLQVSRKIIVDFVKSREPQGLVKQTATNIAGRALHKAIGGLINWDGNAIQKQVNNNSLNAAIKKYLIDEQSQYEKIRKHMIQIQSLPMPSKDSDQLLSNLQQWNRVKQTYSKFKSTSAMAEALYDAIWKMINQYDRLKQYTIELSKNRMLAENTIKMLVSKISNAERDGKPISMEKIIGSNGREDTINQYIQEAIKFINGFIKAIGDRNAKLNLANQQYNNLETRAKEEVSKKDAELKKLEASITLLQTNNSTLQKNLASSQANVRAYADQNTKLLQRINSIQSASKKAMDQYAKNLRLKEEQYQKNLTTKQNQIKKLNQQFQQYKAEKEQQIQQFVSKQQRITNEYDTYKSNAEKKLKIATTQYQQLTTKFNEQSAKAKATITKLLTNVNNLENDVKIAQQDAESSRISYSKLQDQTKDQITKMQINLKETIKQNNKEHEEDQRKQLQTFQMFENSVSKTLKETMDVDAVLTLANFKDKLPALKNKIIDMLNKKLFLVQSSFYNQLTNQRQSFIYDQVKSVVTRRIIGTKTLFEGYPGASFDKWLAKTENKPNILVLLKLKNGFEIGGFSETPFSEQEFNKGKGFLMSITSMKKFPIKPKWEGRVVKYDDYMFGFGNNELLIKSNFVFNVIFKSTYCYFQSGSTTLEEFIGQDRDEGSFVRVQFHQILLEK